MREEILKLLADKNDAFRATWAIARKLKVGTRLVLAEAKKMELEGLIKRNVHTTSNNIVWQLAE